MTIIEWIMFIEIMILLFLVIILLVMQYRDQIIQGVLPNSQNRRTQNRDPWGTLYVKEPREVFINRGYGYSRADQPRRFTYDSPGRRIPSGQIVRDIRVVNGRRREFSGDLRNSWNAYSQSDDFRTRRAASQTLRSAAFHETACRRNPEARWWIDIMDLYSGQQVSGDFSNRLVAGRRIPGLTGTGRLNLTMDATVSRLQFCLYATSQGIMIENLSRVNITRKNGQPVRQPVFLREGDILDLGRMRYMVRSLRRAA